MADKKTAGAFSLVVPAYLEEKRIERFLRELSKVRGIRNAGIILSVDGEDGTEKVARAVSKELGLSVSFSRSKERRGKGGAIIAGVKEARTGTIVFCDCDPNLDLGKIPEFARTALSGNVAIGRRTFSEKRPLYRKFLTWAFNILVRSALSVGFRDTQCGLKSFPKRAFLRAFAEMPENLGRGFDFDLVLIKGVLASGISIAEIPVKEGYDGKTRFSIFPDAIGMFLSVARLALFFRREKPR